MYDVIFSDSARKQINNLEQPAQEKIIAVLERARIRPEAFLVKLVGEEGYKLRAGDYRVIVDLEHSQMRILVIKIGHRKNIYEH